MYRFCFIVLLFCGSPLFGQDLDKLEPGKIHAFAGTGKKGYAGDGGPARDALLNQPFHCEVDGKGNLYIAEAENHCIRKVDLKTGTISTVAGSGKKGNSGDGGPATNATFNEPYAVVIDQEGHLYIADRLNAVIRKVDGKTGTIATIAGTGKKGFGGDGGPGTKALLVEPNDVFLDGRGGLLIADVGDWRVRRLDLKTGVIDTFAGKGRPAGAGKGMPRDKIGDGGLAPKAVVVGARAVCVDDKGNTFICEREGSSIRKVDTKGVITTLAGDGSWGESEDGGPLGKAIFRGPKGVRCDSSGNVFVVDCENHSVRKIDLAAKKVIKVAGGRKGAGGDGDLATKAGMDRPHGCVIDANGFLFIADSNNNRARVVRLKE